MTIKCSVPALKYTGGISSKTWLMHWLFLSELSSNKEPHVLMADWERHDNWPSLISLRFSSESSTQAFIRASPAQGQNVWLPPSRQHSRWWWMAAEMDCCRGRVPDEPWMMNNGSGAISSQEPFRIRLVGLQRKSCWHTPFNQGRNLVTARCSHAQVGRTGTSPAWVRMCHHITACPAETYWPLLGGMIRRNASETNLHWSIQKAKTCNKKRQSERKVRNETLETRF